MARAITYCAFVSLMTAWICGLHGCGRKTTTSSAPNNRIAAFSGDPNISYELTQVDTLPANDLAAQVASYRTWRVVNPEPYDVAAFLIEFCGLVAPAQLKGNPHIYREGMSPQINGSPIRVWVNPVAEIPMFEQATPKFPIGSIIVKEKLIAKREWSSTTSEPRFTKVQPIPELLTVMIKRELGFNTDAGDWEFLVYSGDAQSIQGRGHLHNCQRCHVPQSENDYVFRDYLPAEFRKGPTIAPDRRWRLP